MNRLVNRAPQTVSINGEEHRINTNFRDCLLTVCAIEDANLAQDEKLEILLDNLYGAPWPEDIAEAVRKGLWFLSGGRESDNKKHPRLMDWDIDAERIHSAMLVRGVNLDAVDLHWWTFMSHISELPESAFTRIVYLRDQNVRGKLTKEELRECDRIGWDVINLPSNDPDMPSDDEIWKLLQGE